MKSKTNKEPMSLFDHLGELRRRLIYVLLVLMAAMIAGMAVSRPVIVYLQEVSPLENIVWNVFSPWDSLRIYIQVAFILAMIAAMPFTLYQIWAFMEPGLKAEERKAALIYIPFAFILYLLGIAFAYFVVFPLALYFTRMMTDMLELTEVYGIAQYFSFLFNIVLPISFIFLLPIVVMFLTQLRILNPKKLVKMRRYAYLALVILGAMITPPDAISAIVVSIPMILLYELSVWLSSRVYRKQLENDRANEL